MGKRRFTVIGGDNRNIKLAYLLARDGHRVGAYGLEKGDISIYQYKKLDEAISNADIIIGPLPMTRDRNNFNAPYSVKMINIDEVISLLSEHQIFTAGKIDKNFLLKAKKRGINFQDYFAREEMQVLNAVPTAEGAIQIAMEHMDITLHNSKSMVLGYGRIGKVLTRMLHDIGANIYVGARKYKDLAWAKNFGYIPVHIKELSQYIHDVDVIFNTIPSLILDSKLLSKINKSCIVIELASNPGGIDLKKAQEYKIKLIKANGLPGKVAPITAANIIKDTIYNIIEEWEESGCH